MAFYRTLGLPESCSTLASLIPLHRYIEHSDFTPLHLAVMGVLHVDLAKTLQNPAYAVGTDTKGLNELTPLHIATLRGDPHAAQIVVSAGANLESPTSKGSVPLFPAARYRHPEVVRVLTRSGANPSATDFTGMQPIHGVALADQESTPSVISVLLQHGVDLDSRDEEGYTALTFALGRGTVNTIRFLLERSADPNTVPLDGVLPLFVAVLTSGHVKVELLLQYGADTTVVEKERGYNVLHYVAHAGDVEMMGIFTGREFRRLLMGRFGDAMGRRRRIGWRRGSLAGRFGARLLDW